MALFKQPRTCQVLPNAAEKQYRSRCTTLLLGGATGTWLLTGGLYFHISTAPCVNLTDSVTNAQVKQKTRKLHPHFKWHTTAEPPIQWTWI